MKLVVLGLSLSSSWGNGHATTYRALLKAFAARGHEILFLERDVPWYSGAARDLPDPGFCRLVFYDDLAGLDAHAGAIAAADAVVVGSYVPDGIAVGARVQGTARGVTAFYDIDTPVTLAALAEDRCAYLAAAQVKGYDLYLSFTGGPTLDRLRDTFGAPRAVPLYCCADPDLYRPRPVAKRWDLSYLGTYSDDRQPVLDRLLLEPARRAPHLRFVVAGPQYPTSIAWPANVERLDHVGPRDHADFYNASRFTLNVTRADMKRAGYSPSVRLFEAAACATPVISDVWDGIDTVFTPGESILLAEAAGDVAETLATRGADAANRIVCLSRISRPPHLATRGADAANRIGAAARERVLGAHTAAHRAADLEAALTDAALNRDG